LTTVIGVRFRKVGRVYDFDPDGLDLKRGVPVIVETQKGFEYGECAGEPREVEDEQIVPPLRKVQRVATEDDQETVRRYELKEEQAVETFQKRVEAHGLVMKLVDVEYAFDGSRLVFYFTADGRVDFRELVKDLAGVFRMRIELRQVGVRDEAKMVGGLGICGRAFCCASFLGEFAPVSIKMAKEQNLSLNPAKISGTCGRLMCCLKYEQDAYESLIAASPRAGAVVSTPQGNGVVTDVSLLRGLVQVRLDDAPESTRGFHTDEVRVIKNSPVRDLPARDFPARDFPVRNGATRNGMADETDLRALEDDSPAEAPSSGGSGPHGNSGPRGRGTRSFGPRRGGPK
jgi:cell fate regulator YaaT (PSP1 superfamily)